ncbi:MAG: M3 family oligoendopeptidase [Anaerolineae bacterium]
MATQSNGKSLPHWRLDTIYPALDSAALEDDFAAWRHGISELESTFDARHVGARASDALPERIATDAATIETLETVITQINAVEKLGRQLSAYVVGHVTTDSRDAQAQAWMSRLQVQQARLDKLEPRFAAWVGRLDLEEVTARSDLARAHHYALERTQIAAQHLMSPAEEDLAADLNLTGGRAWARFYNNFSSQITADIEVDGEIQTLPMTAIRNLASDPDRSVRARAYEVELKAWEANAMPIAAALNSIKGQANVLNERRDWRSPQDLALYNNAIDRATLETMLETARAHFPHFRRYLRAKARYLGIESCAWYDLFAPVGGFTRTWTFEAARAFILEQFGSFTSSLEALAKRAFEEGWIDAEPRDGKRGGAFCMWVRDDESRILANYQQAYGGMSTLAHELGHAYHNLNLANRTYLQRQTPMTLAETASNFCQIIVRNAALRQASPEEQLAILEADLQDATQVIVDISSRFLFEAELFERRRERELSAEELCEIMVRSQEETYGDGLDPDLRHPYMWAVKPHYYGSVFYNFPYMFGLLFGLGIYARYREAASAGEDTTGFIADYEALLSSTGMHDAVTLGKRFGIDVRQRDFWESSLALIVEDIDRFERLVGSVTAEESTRG